MKRIFVFCTAVLLLVTITARDRRPKLAVMEIEDADNSFKQRTLEKASEYLRGKIAASNKFMLIARERQRKKAKRLRKESYKQCYDKSCQIPLGQSLAADTILSAKITYFQGRYTLSVELIDLAKEATVKAASFNFKRKKELSGVLDAVVRKITGAAQQIQEESFGEQASSGENIKEKVKKLEKACDGGDAIGCGPLGYLYYNGQGVPKNLKKAAGLLKKACSMGNQKACNAYKILYDAGYGVE